MKGEESNACETLMNVRMKSKILCEKKMNGSSTHVILCEAEGDDV